MQRFVIAFAVSWRVPHAVHACTAYQRQFVTAPIEWATPLSFQNAGAAANSTPAFLKIFDVSITNAGNISQSGRITIIPGSGSFIFKEWNSTNRTGQIKWRIMPWGDLYPTHDLSAVSQPLSVDPATLSQTFTIPNPGDTVVKSWLFEYPGPWSASVLTVRGGFTIRVEVCEARGAVSGSLTNAMNFVRNYNPTTDPNYIANIAPSEKPLNAGRPF